MRLNRFKDEWIIQPQEIEGWIDRFMTKLGWVLVVWVLGVGCGYAWAYLHYVTPIGK